MKALVLGVGLQGKAVIHDLEQSDSVDEIVAADVETGPVEDYLKAKGLSKARAAALDASDGRELSRVVRESRADVVICMLPPDFGYPAARAALDAGISFVSSSYAGRLSELDAEAREKGVAVLPEMGMDPGIDLVFARAAVDELDETHGFASYGAGFPEPACAQDNPVKYKITWRFEGVLSSYKRAARVLRQGREVAIAENEIFAPENIHEVEIPGLGTLEAFPNGDAVHYAAVLGLGSALKDMGRFVLRWQGHCRFWRAMVKLGLLDGTPSDLDGASISPRRFLARHLTPRLQYGPNERDVVVVRIEAWGLKDGKGRKVTYELMDYRDLDSGLFAMNRTVGFTAAIGAQMLLTGAIKAKGVLSPARDVPPESLVRELEARGMRCERRMEPM